MNSISSVRFCFVNACAQSSCKVGRKRPAFFFDLLSSLCYIKPTAFSFVFSRPCTDHTESKRMPFKSIRRILFRDPCRDPAVSPCFDPFSIGISSLCIGPTNAVFALNIASQRGRIGTGAGSVPIDEVVTESPSNQYTLLSAALTGIGTGARTFVMQFNGVSSASTLATFSDGTNAYTVSINGSSELVVAFGGTSINLGTGFADGSDLRVAFRDDGAGNVAASARGGSTSTGTGAPTIGALTSGVIGAAGVPENPIFILPSSVTDAQLEEASDVSTTFACATFPSAMRGGAFDDGFSNGFLI